LRHGHVYYFTAAPACRQTRDPPPGEGSQRETGETLGDAQGDAPAGRGVTPAKHGGNMNPGHAAQPDLRGDRGKECSKERPRDAAAHRGCRGVAQAEANVTPQLIDANPPPRTAACRQPANVRGSGAQ